MGAKPRVCGVGLDRDIALVLSGGGMNGVLLELGFLRRLREDARWERVGFVYGTSAGALSGTMGALDRLDELEAFLMALQPHETFRPHRLWRLPLLGLHDYALPETIAERVEPVESLAADLATAKIELVVCATDVSERDVAQDGAGAYELTWWSRAPASARGDGPRRCSLRRRSARSSCRSTSATVWPRTAAGSETSRSRTPTRSRACTRSSRSGTCRPISPLGRADRAPPPPASAAFAPCRP